MKNLLAATFLLVFTTSLSAHDSIALEFDLDSYFGDLPTTMVNPRAYVVIDAIADERVQPAMFGEPVKIIEGEQNQQIGFAAGDFRHGSNKRGVFEHPLLLGEIDTIEFTRAVLTRAFAYEGYAIIPASDAHATDAVHVSVAIDSFWLWQSISGERYAYNADYAVRVSSDGAVLSNLGRVHSYSVRSGRRTYQTEKKLKSNYSNTMKDLFSAFLNDYSLSLQQAERMAN